MPHALNGVSFLSLSSSTLFNTCPSPPPPHPKVRRVCGDPGVDGVLVQLPLPRHCDEGSVMEQLDPSKDVDGFHPLNMG